jgi:hypothetical protein
MTEITRILAGIEQGEPHAAEATRLRPSFEFPREMRVFPVTFAGILENQS